MYLVDNNHHLSTASAAAAVAQKQTNKLLLPSRFRFNAYISRFSNKPSQLQPQEKRGESEKVDNVVTTSLLEHNKPQIHMPSPETNALKSIAKVRSIASISQQELILPSPPSPNPTSAWLEEQQQQQQRRRRRHSNSKAKPTDERKVIIPPIRSFRSSTDKHNLEMIGRIPTYRYDSSRANSRAEGELEEDDDDRDRTLRALEGKENHYGNNTNGYRGQNDDQRQAADSEDLFLNLARDDFIPGVNRRNSASRPEKRKSRIALPSNRYSMPPVASYRRQTTDGQDEEQSSTQTTRMPQSSRVAQRERSSTTTTAYPSSDLSRSRYTAGGIPKSSPITPRATTFSRRDFSPELVSPTTTRKRRPSMTDTTMETVVESGRRSSLAETSRRSSITENPRKPSITETAISIPRSQYRQSNLSYSSPRAYNSSPLVSRTLDINDEADVPRETTEETGSTVSTTAQSTIWDELDDIKQRMRRLEVMGKMPPTSGATMSNSSNERPRTATTTATTNSTSPKRGRGNSTVSFIDATAIGFSHGEAHPNLRAALAKSKSLLNTDVYEALEKTANDALTITAMMGTAGQPGPISSAHSAIGTGTSSITDRQVRKKAENMCRSLTELCIALNDRKVAEVPPTESKSTGNPTTREETARDLAPSDTTSTLRKVSDVGGQALTRLRASPRTLDRLSERRHSLFASSSVPASPQVTTPTQTTNSGRRSSLLLRSRRAVTEEPEDNETRDARFRAPSRAVTEVAPVGRTRNTPREYTSSRPLPDVREPPAQSPPSLLPLRRQFISDTLASSLPMSPATPNAPVSRLESRRYLERAATRPQLEREGGVETQPEDNRTLRKPSGGLAFEGLGRGRTSSITRRRRENNGAES